MRDCDFAGSWDTGGEIISLRHWLHRFPELSMKEGNTIKTIRNFLTGHTSIETVEREGWLYAVKYGCGRTDQGAIAFRADMDALPMEETLDMPYRSVHKGISHKCGHDGHCAVLCAMALELDRIETERDVYFPL